MLPGFLNLHFCVCRRYFHPSGVEKLRQNRPGGHRFATHNYIGLPQNGSTEHKAQHTRFLAVSRRDRFS